MKNYIEPDQVQRTETKINKFPINFQSNMSSKLSERNQNSENKDLYLKPIVDSFRKAKLDDEISTISTHSEYMNGVKSFKKPSLGIQSQINSARTNLTIKNKIPQEKPSNWYHDQL